MGERAETQARFVLASASPRRQELIRLLGLTARVAPQDLDEEAHAGPDPLLSALSIARAKASSARESADDGEIVLAADTVVVHEGHSLGKPREPVEAVAMLRGLRAKVHRVATGVVMALAGSHREWSVLVTTAVRMRPYGDDEIEAYVARREPFDKAGGYAIQDPVFQPVEELNGCFLNVVGLPLCAVQAGLEALGTAAPLPSTRPLTPPCDLCRASGLLPEALLRPPRSGSGRNSRS